MLLLLSLCLLIRIVNEAHSSATKKNKEWQQKLPIVVLKAEEIVYSKANSEVCFLFLLTFKAAQSSSTAQFLYVEFFFHVLG